MALAAVALVVTLLLAATPGVTQLGPDSGVPGVSDPPWRAWTTEEAVEMPEGALESDFLNPRLDMVFDEANQPHVAFTTFSPDPDEVLGVWYAHREDGDWHRSSVARWGFAESIALDNEGDPWIGAKSSTVYTQNTTGGEWWKLDAPRGADGQVAVDEEGDVHVVSRVFRSDADHRIRHHVIDPDNPQAGWSTGIVATFPSDVHGGLDMAMTPDGEVHVVWYSDSKVRYAEPTGSGDWGVHTLTGCGLEDRHIDGMAIGLGPEGQAHLACWKRGTGVLHVTPASSGGFAYELVSDGSQLVPPRGPNAVGRETELAVDSEDRVHVSFSTGHNPFFRDDPFRPMRPVYAVEANPPDRECPNGGDVPLVRANPQDPCERFHVQAVDHDGTGSGDGTAIAVDDEGVPGLAYMYEWRVGTDWVEGQQVPSHPVVNPHDALRFAEPVQRAAQDAASGVS